MAKQKKVLLWVACFLLLLSIITYEYPMSESWTAWSLPLSGAIIAIDPGHGGFDGGAVSKSGLIEKDVALNISLYLRDFLQEAGALVIMTREIDDDLADGAQGRKKRADIHQRVRLINSSHADLAVSIHLNAIPSPKWYGAQTFYYPAKLENQTLAFLIQDEIRVKLENTTRFAKPKSDMYLLKNVEMASVLVEVGFLSNPGEAAKLASEKYQKSMANAIYQGILRYYGGESIPKTEYVE
ncbi:N-acetylmuramoyl-L-alanine amidase CwlD [Ammoniphilus sp. YIM 78166]|uniref:N-acetylmuramoyl-L-alanine amidase CwlD n=1 Tax=Ammoniphilus sp. YIM 78166 TaxID=1644106 RepID=UPI00106F150D|nr:N-acetylmuramoyl-L-alanine amidase CwlD [Ammoniphilus sp. YIM 78166]